MTPSERAQAREAELALVVDAPSGARTLLLACWSCGKTDATALVHVGEAWMLMCWGCRHVRTLTRYES